MHATWQQSSGSTRAGSRGHRCPLATPEARLERAAVSAGTDQGLAPARQPAPTTFVAGVPPPHQRRCRWPVRRSAQEPARLQWPTRLPPGSVDGGWPLPPLPLPDDEAPPRPDSLFAGYWDPPPPEPPALGAKISSSDESIPIASWRSSSHSIPLACASQRSAAGPDVDRIPT